MTLEDFFDTAAGQDWLDEHPSKVLLMSDSIIPLLTDWRYALDVAMAEYEQGPHYCPLCHGSGGDAEYTCPKCGGKGEV